MSGHAGGGEHHSAHRARGEDAPGAMGAPSSVWRRRRLAAMLGTVLCAATCAWWGGAASSPGVGVVGLLGVGVPLPLPGFQLPAPRTVADARTESKYASTMDRIMSSFGGHDAAVAALRGQLAAGGWQFRGRQQGALRRKSLADRSQATSRVLGLLQPDDNVLRESMTASNLDTRMGEGSTHGMGQGFTPAAAAASSVFRGGGSSGYAEQANLRAQIASAQSVNSDPGGLGGPTVPGDAASAAAEADSIFKGGGQCLLFCSLFLFVST